MKKILIVALLILFITITASSLGAVEFGPNSANITNPYMTVNIRGSSILAGYGSLAGLFKYHDRVGTEFVDGVKCLRFNSVDLKNIWFTAGWAAQDISGNVYLLKFYDTENLTPVVLGKDNAVLIMPINIKVGDKIQNGDETVVEIGVTVPQLLTGLGPFTNCLKTMEKDGDINYYAPNSGHVKKEYPAGSWQLKEILPTKNRVVVIPLSD